MKFSLKKNTAENIHDSHIWSKSIPSYMNPLRDWTIGLVISTMVLIGGIAYTAHDFYLQFGAPSRDVTAEIQPVSYNEKEVIEYARLYSEREDTFNALRASRVYIPPEVSEVIQEEIVENTPLAE